MTDTPASPAAPPDPLPPRMRWSALLRHALSGLAVLLLVLALNGALTLGALRTVHEETVSAAARVVGNDWTWRLEGALRFGKPIQQFYGLQDMLAEVLDDLPAVESVAVTGPQGESLAQRGVPLPPEALSAAVERALAEDLPAVSREGGTLHVFPVQARDGSRAGALVLAVPDDAVTAGLVDAARQNFGVLLLVAGGGGLALFLGAVVIAPLRRDLGRPDRPGARLRLMLLPVLVLVGAQAIYSWESISTFREQYVTATRAAAALTADRLQRDLDRLLDKGVTPDRFAGIDKPFLRIMAHQEEVAFMDLEGPGGEARVRVYRDGRVVDDPPVVPRSPVLDVTRPLGAGDGAVDGGLRAHLSSDAIAAGVRQRLLDSGTVAVISALFMVELVIVLTLLLRARAARAAAALARPTGASAAAEPDDPVPPDRRHMLARPAAFLMIFAWALPLTFIPLRMRELAAPVPLLPRDVVVALPISAEMLCALVTAMLAGVLTDRRGWHVPFLAGTALTVAGSAWSALAADMVSFTLARALVGLGYGMAWMGIQGFVFVWSLPQSRGRGIANLVAGIFAGHICGSAVGAMLAEQLGYPPVFGASAVLGVLPAVFVLAFMRPWLSRPPEPPAASTPVVTAVEAPSGVGRLLGSRGFLWLLLGSVVPFSIAQVGLLYYTLPLFLADQGVGQGSIGRIMMLYGLSVIYLGPMLGRLVDASPHKRRFIVLAGLVGSGGMIYLFFDHSLFAITQAVVLLGLAAAVGGAAQSAFALDLPEVKAVGTGKAMGVQRAADKLGQMLGPLVIGALFAAVGAGAGLAMTGLFYLAATLAFLMLAVPAARAMIRN